MRLYLLKSNMLSYICNSPENLISTDDFESFDKYPQYNFVYNKEWVAHSQGIENRVPKYPVIVRPRINLKGMGVGAHYVYNIKELNKIPKDYFWSNLYHGDHISVDIFINRENGIQDTIAFKGIPGKLFTFKHWESMPYYQLPIHIKKWILRYLTGYNGIINLEIIGDKIIECHLRMGDLNYFQDKNLMKCVIDCYQGKSITLPKLNKIYLVPVFAKKGDYKKLKKEEIYYAVRQFNSQHVLNYLIDPNVEDADPAGGTRVCNFTVSNLKTGQKIRDFIHKNYFNY